MSSIITTLRKQIDDTQMADPTRGRQTGHRPSGSASSFDTFHQTNIMLISEYAPSTRDNLKPWVQVQETNDYGNVESWGSCGCEDKIPTLFESAAEDGTWRGGRTIEPDNTKWSTRATPGSGRDEMNYVMTGMGAQQEELGVEGSDDQRSKRPPQLSVAEITEEDPYSSTEAGAIANQNLVEDGGKQVVSPGQHVHDEDEKGTAQPGWKIEDLDRMFPSPCLLGGCKGLYVFQTLSTYRTHVKNVHGKAIYCRVPECIRNLTRPFASENDRLRHYRARHDPNPNKTFICERSICPARVKAFSRRDKLNDHNKKYHMQVPCHICSYHFDSFDELSQHTNNDHGSFGIGAMDI